jgi:3-oxoacyl-[acyl-carrier protein] reductase
MDLGLRGRVAVVVGSSRGIGRAIATTLAREGARLVVCARGRDALKAAADAIRTATGADVLAIQGDVLQPADVTRLIAETVAHYDRLDILVTNAGGPPYAAFPAISPETWDESYRLVLRSVILLCREAVPHMQRRGWGRIIAISSVAAKQLIHGLMISTVMRAGVVGFTKSLSQELAPHGITVNAVCPGYINTETFIERARSRAEHQEGRFREIVGDIERRIPLGRVGSPEELAAVVAFLASEPASYLTGTMIPVDGGFVQAIM